MTDTRDNKESQRIPRSLMDYAMPSFVGNYHPAPATTNPLGVNGGREAGCVTAMVAAPNAIIGAISTRQ
jgi:hypothetical protein